MNLKRAFLILIAAMFLPGVALAQDLSIGMTASVSFSDGNDVDTVTVSFVCNDGISPIGQAVLGDGDTFRHPNAGMADTFICTVSATSVDNYTATDSCEYTVADLGESDTAEVTCDFVMTPDGATITVTKYWDLSGAGGDEVDTSARIEAKAEEGVLENGGVCDGDLMVPLGEEEYYTCVYLDLEGDEAEGSVMVNTSVDGAMVTISETGEDSSVEVTNDCGTLEVFPGDEVDCSITNTVFFEGIPTLSQYGMAIMVLLMLGVGFVGFRRIV